jgi:hypothetical protein
MAGTEDRYTAHGHVLRLYIEDVDRALGPEVWDTDTPMAEVVGAVREREGDSAIDRSLCHRSPEEAAEHPRTAFAMAASGTWPLGPWEDTEGTPFDESGPDDPERNPESLEFAEFSYGGSPKDILTLNFSRVYRWEGGKPVELVFDGLEGATVQDIDGLDRLKADSALRGAEGTESYWDVHRHSLHLKAEAVEDTLGPDVWGSSTPVSAVIDAVREKWGEAALADSIGIEVGPEQTMRVPVPEDWIPDVAYDSDTVGAIEEAFGPEELDEEGIDLAQWLDEMCRSVALYNDRDDTLDVFAFRVFERDERSDKLRGLTLDGLSGLTMETVRRDR